MAFHSGFFNSKNLDRTYTAENFCDYLGSIICNGIQDNYGDCFRLLAASSGLSVSVGRGKAWINGHYFINDARYSINLSEYMDESLPRYVGIAIYLDTTESVRSVTLKLFPGTPAESPQLPSIPQDEEHVRLLMYAVRLNPGATSLTEHDWWDYREDANVCGYCKCILGKCKVTDLMAQMAQLIAEVQENNETIEELTNKVEELTAEVEDIGDIVAAGQCGENVFYCFFNIQRNDGDLLFDGLDIMKYPDFCKENMNQYPVIFLSLKDVEGLTFDIAFEKFQDIICDFCIRNESLGNHEQVNQNDKALFQKLQARTASIAEMHTCLKTIMRMMYTVYGKQVILLIDEYDVPLAKAHYNGFYQEMLDVIRGLMSTSLKTNPYLKFAVVTGCLRIPKESIFTGVNNFASYSVMDEEFSQYFGFTQNEVEAFLSYYDLADKLDITKEWYDGYLFGTTEIYCPWDVSNFIKALTKNPDIEPKNYWENTSSNNAISAFFDMPDCDPSEKFETLLNDGTISETITDALTYDHAYDSESNLWSVLLMTGYVTLAQINRAASGKRELRIPNKEVATIFQTAVVDQFKSSINETELHNLMTALWEGNEETASTILSNFLWNTISYNDYHEDYYHAFLAGLFVGRGYAVYSNKERGLGRPDIDLRDRKQRRCIIIEAKHSEKPEQMEKDCQKAIKQIRDNQYALKLTGYTTVLRYGVAFFQKTALIKLDPDDLPNE